MKTYNVRAKRWARGWELHVDGVGVTQAHNLAEAESMSRSYITMVDNPAKFDVCIIPEIGDGVDAAVRHARRAISDADRAQRDAAKAMRSVTADLHQRGLTGRDIARVLDVSPQRVSQLLAAR